MPDIAPKDSLSLYRGQTQSGQGEGPSRAVSHGEQYFEVDPRLYKDELLDEIRPWTTLDADPADHQRLNNRLEGWSLFTLGNYFFVVRLASAGTYDRRAAYFTHARAWNVSRLAGGFDPGLYLGQSSAFDQPGVVRAPGSAIPDTSVPHWPEQVKSDPDAAARFLGHLLQAMVEGYPLVAAVPVAAFTAGGSLHGIVSFARAGLPAKLRNDCRIRVYSRLSELFLRHLGVHLLVVPEDEASGALSARPNATLIDPQGRVASGKELDDRAREYAAAVVERAHKIPEALPYFSERFQRLMWRGTLPSLDDARAVQITFNVAYAMARPERRAAILREYLPWAAAKLSRGFDWNRLIDGNEWKEFPQDALMDHVLADTRDLSEPGREFLQTVEEAASRLGLRADDRLAQWWNPEDPAKVQRLVELLGQTLVSESAVAERTIAIPIGRLAQTGGVAQILRAELKHKLLPKRARESAQLASLATDEAVFDVLTDAVVNQALDVSWALSFVATAPPNVVAGAAHRWSNLNRFFTGWDDVPRELLQRLRREKTGANLERFAREGLELDPVDHLEVYLLAADLLSRTNPQDRNFMSSLRRALPRLDAGRLIDVLFDPGWTCLQLDTIELALLLDLARDFQDDDHYGCFYEELDARMRVAPETTTRELVRTGWWFFWRRRSGLQSPDDHDALERSAIAWLTSSAWTAKDAEPSMEAWRRAIEDLPPKISGLLMARLRGDNNAHRQPWPWIQPFEEDQLIEMIRRAGDLGALAEIVETLQDDDSAPPFTNPLNYVMSHSQFANNLPVSALQWLLRDRFNVRKEPLTIPQSSYLEQNAGHRQDRALNARVAAVVHHLPSNAKEALREASQPSLWSNGEFLYEVAAWMNGRRTLDAIGEDTAAYINEHVSGRPARNVHPPSYPLVDALLANGYASAAGLIDANRRPPEGKQPKSDAALQALIRGSHTDSCWQKLANEVRHASAGVPHPLAALADSMRGTDLSAEDRLSLAINGWRTFELVAEVQSGIMSPLPHKEADLPAFTLAALMAGPGAMGIAALQVIITPSNRGNRQEPSWWKCLLRSIRDFRRYDGWRCADDRESIALALIAGTIEDPEERYALNIAIANEAQRNLEWETLQEFVKSRP